MEPTTFTALKAMEKLGFIIRKRSPDNKKNVYICLTAKGRALKKKLQPLAEDINRIAIAGVKASDVATTRKTLLAIIENLAHEEITSTNQNQRMRSTREWSRLITNA
jgi:DNA-binding MarR family transcriptional regulator